MIDYDRLCALVGKTWAYITPSYFYEEMDIFDVSKLVPLLDQAEYLLCWSRRRKGKNIEQAVKDGVIKRG